MLIINILAYLLKNNLLITTKKLGYIILKFSFAKN
ncbi:hypothetical protein Celal_2663 [Cellulophaga algicola DSM 14237]|uniref:Uncharacterized protein n=1 Tax=Cellulophaga algicola (strain DSM 14237 / IC166 / ACAM 630) TaxID=688270 RepID=E6XB84_CELAD|nr:hypothetical protein Celal_2663 [Cellulophaga algicola DSM 14237]